MPQRLVPRDDTAVDGVPPPEHEARDAPKWPGDHPEPCRVLGGEIDDRKADEDDDRPQEVDHPRGVVPLGLLQLGAHVREITCSLFGIAHFRSSFLYSTT